MGNDSLGRWDIALLFIIIFVAGTAFGRLVTPLLFREHSVLVIHGSKPEGCRGETGWSPIYFNKWAGSGDGSYLIACNERSHQSYNLDLLCDCSEGSATELKGVGGTKDGK